MNDRKPRPEVIRHLTSMALDSWNGCGVDDLSVAEVTSAAFTVVTKVCKTLIDESPKEDLDRNIDVISTAIANLYSMLPERTIH